METALTTATAISDALKRGGSLVLSPHSDDAALSLGGAILGRYLPLPIAVATLFGYSNYARGQFHPDAVRVTSMRRSEDEHWAQRAKARLIWLTYPEAGVRVGSSFEHIFAPPSVSHYIWKNLTRTVSDLIDRVRPRLVLVPLGIGGHCDHVIVREIAGKVCRSHNVLTAYYEDLPYVHGVRPKDVERAVSAAMEQPRSVLLPMRDGELDEKCARLYCYATQVEDSMIEAVRSHGVSLASAHGAERVWCSACDLGSVRSCT